MSRSTKSSLKATRATDFAETGEYEVRTSAGVKRIYRDTSFGFARWLITPVPDPAVFSSDYLGDTREAALRRLEEMFGAP